MDWEGYGLEECSCVNAADILGPTLIEEFHGTLPYRPAPRARGAVYKEEHREVFLGVGALSHPVLSLNPRGSPRPRFEASHGSHPRFLMDI